MRLGAPSEGSGAPLKLKRQRHVLREHLGNRKENGPLPDKRAVTGIPVSSYCAM